MNRDLHNTVGDTAHLWQQRQRSAMQGPIEQEAPRYGVPWAHLMAVGGIVLFILFGFVWR